MASSTVSLCAESRAETPAWAVLERQLIQAIDAALPVFVEKYTHPNGELIWRTGEQVDSTFADDLYEAFFNWPLYHALGGSDYANRMAGREWKAITRQLADLGQVTKEFVNGADWYHHGENYIYLYHLGWSDPALAGMEDRARRFAGFYLGENEQVRNYDREFRLIPSPRSGGRGLQKQFQLPLIKYHLEKGHETLGAGFDLPENWLEDDAEIARVRDRFNQVVMREDVPLNLTSTALATHAYLYTGEEKYRDWVIEYTEAWIERTERNGGIVPDNVGPSGKVGEHRQGQWWGGFYGWTCEYAPGIISTAVAVAAECSYLMTGDGRYLQFLRSHLDMLIEKGVEKEGKLLVPGRHTDEGWIDHRPLVLMEPIHLWANSMEERDWTRLERLRRGDEEAWEVVEPRGSRGADDRAWVRFISGELPDYPEQILEANLCEVARRLEMVLQDEEDLTLVSEHHWQERNPVITEALSQLTTGGPQTMYWGGLTQGRLRYFDEAKRHPGLPDDVAALVTGLAAGCIDLTLVNLSREQWRRLLIGAGSFGEHRFRTASVHGKEGVIEVAGPHLQVELPPGSQIDLHLTMERFCCKPSYLFPWNDASS